MKDQLTEHTDYEKILNKIIAAKKEQTHPVLQWIMKKERLLMELILAVLFFLSWEMLVNHGWLNSLFFSSPTRIISEGIKLAVDGTLGYHIMVSSKEFIIGLALAFFIGAPLGIVIGWYRRIGSVFDPFVNALNATPRIALVPLIIIWVGIGIWSKVILIFLSAFFPIIISADAGVRNADATFLKAARSFGASDWNIFRTVILPSSVPFLVAGSRLAVARGLIGVVVGELYGATAGVGYMISVAGSNFNSDRIFVGVIILAAAGVVLSEIFGMIEKRFEVWRP